MQENNTRVIKKYLIANKQVKFQMRDAFTVNKLAFNRLTKYLLLQSITAMINMNHVSVPLAKKGT